MKPKKWKSWRVCPECGSKATKIFNLNSGKYNCQICEHQYDPPEKNHEHQESIMVWFRP